MRSLPVNPRVEVPEVLAGKSARWRAASLGILGAAAVASLVLATAGSAAAAPGDTSVDTTEAHVGVGSSILLSGLTPEFTLNGLPGATVASDGAVTMTVTTNNLGGYAVTVQGAAAAMIGDDAANADSIPIGALSVRESGTTPYTALSSTASVPVHTQAVRSAELGDALSNDYRVAIPFVNEDTYSATLNYVATTL